MDLLRAMRVFRRVVELGGFSAAARDQRMSNAAVSKEIAALEEHLGARLLLRTTRRVAPTTAGQAYYARCVGILDDVEDAALSVADGAGAPRGLVRLNVPMSFGLLHVSSLLPELLARHPDLELDVTYSDGFVDVVEDRADLVLRVAKELPDSTTLVVQRLARARHVLCAAPAYLEARGEPRAPADLATHACLVYGRGRQPGVWTFTRGRKVEAVRVRGRLTVDNSLVLRDAALAGAGLAVLPAFYVDDDLRAGRLRALLAGFELPVASIHVVHQPSRTTPRRVRVVIDLLRERFAAAPWALR